MSTPLINKYAERAMKQLEENRFPPLTKNMRLPAFNPSTGRSYAGLNQHTLNAAPYSDPRWLTAKQARQYGYHPKKGAKAEIVVYHRRDNKENTFKNEYACVFNVEQLQGFPSVASKDFPVLDPELALVKHSSRQARAATVAVIKAIEGYTAAKIDRDPASRSFATLLAIDQVVATYNLPRPEKYFRETIEATKEHWQETCVVRPHTLRYTALVASQAAKQARELVPDLQNFPTPPYGKYAPELQLETDKLAKNVTMGVSLDSMFIDIGAAQAPQDIRPTPQWQRLASTTDKQGEKSISYKCHERRNLKFVTARNWQTGQTFHFAQKVEALNKEATREAYKAQRDTTQKEITSRFTNAVERLKKNLPTYTPLGKDIATNDYATTKGISELLKSAPFNRDYNTFVLPLQNIKGDITTAQYISTDGKKRYAANGRKTGSFYPIDPATQKALSPEQLNSALAKASTVVVCEGVSTAATLAEVASTSQSGPPAAQVVIAACDANNLPVVVKDLAKTYPSPTYVIAADNDREVEKKIGKNPGLDAANKAKAAAAVANPDIAVTVMNPHDLSPSDKLDTITDFNDLALSNPEKKKEILTELKTAAKSAFKSREAARTEKLEQARETERGQQR